MKNIIFLIIHISISFYSAKSFSQDNTITNLKHFNLESNQIAIEGYDVVAYFTDNKALKGNSKYKIKYAGIIYHFSSEKNKIKFSESPTKYTPQYGGWCAYAMGAKGKKVDINPKSFKVSNEKLYLFYKNYLSDTKENWNKDYKNLQQKADKNWAQIIN